MKKLIAGIIIGLMLGVSTNAFAAVGDTVSAVFAEFSYVVNGENKNLDSPVLVHDGNSYLRTTQISNMLGYDVTYKADSRTIEFDKPDPIIETPTADPAPTEGTTTPNITPTPTVTPAPIPEPIVTPEPVPDNTAYCQQLRDKHTLEIFNYKNSNNPFSGQYNVGLNTLKQGHSNELASAGCN